MMYIIGIKKDFRIKNPPKNPREKKLRIKLHNTAHFGYEI